MRFQKIDSNSFASTLGALVVLLSLSACAGPVSKQFQIEESVIEAEAQLQRRAYIRKIGNDLLNYRDVGYKVLIGAAPLCGDKLTFWSGIESWTEDQFSSLVGKDKKYKDATRVEFGVQDQPTVVKVFAASPAEKAGVKVGDVFVGIDDWNYKSETKKSSALFAKSKKSIPPVEIDPDTLLATSNHEYHFLRDGNEITLSMQPVARCDYNLYIQAKDQFNAMADGNNIIVDVRMLRWFKNNDQLGIVIGHELAHNSMKHMEKKSENAVAGAIIGGVFDVLLAIGGVNTGGAFSDAAAQGGALANSSEFESEADYVGLYAAALSGINIKEAPEIWRDVSLQGTASIDFTTTHPRTPYRAKALEKAVEEILAKQATGRPLKPELKEDDNS